MREEKYTLFVNSLLDATQQIEPTYFHLPVAYNQEHVERERNYCYELYRHIRNNLPGNFGYTISGEVDKSGHEIISPLCGDIIPDFLIQRPGNMGPGDNLIILEAKTFKGATTSNKNSGILKDIKTINCMLNITNGYYKGILLVFGNGSQKKRERIREVYSERCDRERITLIYHDAPLTRATIID